MAIKQKFNFYLVIKNPFNDYAKGQEIHKGNEIQTIIDAQMLQNCLKVNYKGVKNV